jgi:hypothetical protein
LLKSEHLNLKIWIVNKVKEKSKKETRNKLAVGSRQWAVAVAEAVAAEVGNWQSANLKP